MQIAEKFFFYFYIFFVVEIFMQVLMRENKERECVVCENIIKIC
jgi:hypothetical protein